MARSPGRARGYVTLVTSASVIPPRPAVGTPAPNPWAGGTAAPVNSVLPAITGTAQEGQVLSVSNGTWSNTPTGYTYQWKRGGVAISGSINATRTLAAADIGAVMTCTVTAANAGGSASATSAGTAVVIAASVPVPVNTVAPAVTGTGTIGQVLTSDTGTWSNSPTSYAYAWRRDGVDIAGATASTYALVSADGGTAVTCRVYATNAGGTAGATSNSIAVAVAAPTNTAAPVASGTPTVGQTLSTTNGTWTGSPTSFAYQWRRDGVNVSGATASTYVVVSADQGTTLTCAVSATNVGGTSGAVASNGLAVAAATPAPAFTTQPSMTPTSGTAGSTTFTASDGAASNATGYTRRWLLSGVAIGTAATVLPSSAGSLVLEVTATGPGGSTVATSSASTVTAAATALPSGVIARWSADDIPAQTDNTNLVTWTDSVGSIAATQATASRQGQYRTGGMNGKPFVRFPATDGNQAMPTSNSNAVATALASAASTVFIVMRNTGATTLGCPFTGGFLAYPLIANGSIVGQYLAGDQQTYYSHPASTFTVYVYTSGATGSSINGRSYINGSCVMNWTPVKANGTTHIPSIAGASGNGYAYKGDLYDVGVLNRVATPADVLQIVKWACDKYAQTYPWAGASYFRVFDGDSIPTGAYASSASFSTPARVAVANGWPLGTWTNMGKPGATMAAMTTAASVDVDGFAAQLGSVPVELFVWEWTNQRALTGSAAWTAFQTYLQARQAAGSVTRIVVGNSIDVGGGFRNSSQDTQRADYNSRIASGYSTYAAALVDLAADASVGQTGAAPNAAPYGAYFKNVFRNAAASPTGGAATSGIATLTTTNDTLLAGDYIIDARFPAETYVVTRNSAGNYTMSANANTTFSGATLIAWRGDGYHPGDAGYQKIADLVASAML